LPSAVAALPIFFCAPCISPLEGMGVRGAKKGYSLLQLTLVQTTKLLIDYKKKEAGFHQPPEITHPK